jgi:hypothetical protein
MYINLMLGMSHFVLRYREERMRRRGVCSEGNLGFGAEKAK